MPLLALLTLISINCALLRNEVQAQPIPTVQDCMGAIPVCQDFYTQETTYLGSGNYPNEIYNPGGDCTLDCPGSCLDGEQNSVWYIFTVQTTGLLRLTIDPFVDNDDYDWALYDVTFLRCDQIYTSYPTMQMSCNAWGSNSYNGNTGISTAEGGLGNCNHCGDDGSTRKWNADLAVNAGSTYVLVIENWGQSPDGGYTLDFSASTAEIYDNIRPLLLDVHSEDLTCGSTTFLIEFSENVTCESVNPTDFILSGLGGPYTVTGVSGETCELGGEMEREYTLTFEPAIRHDGDYSLQMTPFNFIYDACGNFAQASTISFLVLLGGPIINVSGMEISPATCGLSNGSISGITVTGNDPLEYYWTDQVGDTVGYELDLMDVPSGQYTLHVTDGNTCAAAGGPYTVSATGGPEVLEAGLNIVAANYGANNGSITGLAIDGTGPYTFTWTDDSGNEVGNTLDLTGLYTGLYSLAVVDANDCDTVAGPYFVPVIGGPLGVTVTADPGEICMGEEVQLHAYAFGGTEAYSYTWSSLPEGFHSDIPNPLVYPVVTTTYTVVVDDNFNTTQSSITVDVFPIPVGSAGTDDTIPYGTSTTLYGSAVGGSGNYMYAWEPAPLLILSDVPNPPTKNLYQTTFFTVTVTDVNTGCISLEDTVMVYLSGGPLGMSLLAQDDSICMGSSTVITAYGSGGNYPEYTYTWYESDVEVKEEEAPISSLTVMPETVGQHTYEVRIDDGYNFFWAEIQITVLAKPEFYISGGPEIIACPYDSVLLAPSQLYPGADYYWSNGCTTPSQKVGTTGIGFDVRTYSLTVTTEEGCTQSGDVTVVFDFSACFGIEEGDRLPALDVFPNPANHRVTVDFENGSGFSFLFLVNSLGGIVLSRDLHEMGDGRQQLVLDVSMLPPGIYLLEAIHERYIHHRPLVIQ